MQEIEQRIWDLIQPGVDDMELRLVRVLLSGGETNSRLQIMIEPMDATRDNRTSVTIDECEGVSRMVSAIMDVEDPLPQQYTLEVSSTGLERPLVLKDDFEAYASCGAKVELTDAVDGRKRFNGKVLGMKGDDIAFQTEEGNEVMLPFNLLKKARLVYSDDEMRQFMKKSEG